MHLHFVSLFPQIFDSFFATSLLRKARDQELISVHYVNPRDYCDGPHKQVDDNPYGGGDGMVLKAEPFLQAVESIIDTIDTQSYKILFPSPSPTIFNQSHALSLSSYKHLIFICGRYEGIDARCEHYLSEHYTDHFLKISLGQFILLGGEVASMTMTEAITRLVPGVIKETGSWQAESYNPLQGMGNIEHPHYTRPADVRGMKVPDILLSSDDGAINEWRNNF